MRAQPATPKPHLHPVTDRGAWSAAWLAHSRHESVPPPSAWAWPQSRSQPAPPWTNRLALNAISRWGDCSALVSPGSRANEYVAYITQRTGVAIYFCDPRSPWQRGSNENINGLSRQYLSKGTDLSGYSQEQLDAIAYELNIRPRQRFDYKCPIEMMTAMIAKHHESHPWLNSRVLHSASETAVEKRWHELETDKMQLPEYIEPGERLYQTKRGHRKLINKEDNNLRRLELEHELSCSAKYDTKKICKRP